MAARGPRLLQISLRLLLILSCALTTIVCRDTVALQRRIRVRRGATEIADPEASVVHDDYVGTSEKFASSLWSLLQTMETFDTKKLESRSEEAIASVNLSRVIPTISTADKQTKGTTIPAPSTTETNTSELVKHTQSLHGDDPSVVQLLAPNDLSPATNNPELVTNNNSISNITFEDNETRNAVHGSGGVMEEHGKSPDVFAEPLPTKELSSFTDHIFQGQASTTLSPTLAFNSLSFEASEIPFNYDSTREKDTIHNTDESEHRLHPPHRRKKSRVHPSHHHNNPKVERTTQPSRNIMYVVMMQDRPCDGKCCRRESYSGKCRLSLRCAVMHFHRTDMRQLTCGTSYHSLEVPVHNNFPRRPSNTNTRAFPGITPRSTVSTNGRNSSIDSHGTKEQVETVITPTPASATKSKQGPGRTNDPEVTVGNTGPDTTGGGDVKQTLAGIDGARTHVRSGNSGIDIFVNREVVEGNPSTINFNSSKGTIDEDVQNTTNDTENNLHTTEETTKDYQSGSSSDEILITVHLHQSGSVDPTNTTEQHPNITVRDDTHDLFDSVEDFGKNPTDENADGGSFELFDGEYFGGETDDDFLSNETWPHTHNETEDDTEFGEFDAYVTDDQSDIDYNYNDYTRDPEYDDDHYYTDYVGEGVIEGEAGNGSPRHLVYTDQVWYGGTDLALGPRELSEVEAVQLSSPNNWHRFGDDNDAEWLNEENKRKPHLVLSSLVDREHAGQV